MKPPLTLREQVDLLVSRGLSVRDRRECVDFLSVANYYRFSGYARYFQQAPHMGDDSFAQGSTFDGIREIYEADAELRIALLRSLAQVELALRSHLASVVATQHGAYGRYLERTFYVDARGRESTVGSCLRDITRSKDRHILHFSTSSHGRTDYSNLPVWSAVEAWSFGTLSKVIQRGARGRLGDAIATSLGIAKSGFAHRVRSLVYLRNRCAHHGRLWHHSVLDAGPTPNNVRNKVRRDAGQFDPRSVTRDP